MVERFVLERLKVRRDWFKGLAEDPIDHAHPDVGDEDPTKHSRQVHSPSRCCLDTQIYAVWCPLSDPDDFQSRLDAVLQLARCACWVVVSATSVVGIARTLRVRSGERLRHSA